MIHITIQKETAYSSLIQLAQNVLRASTVDNML